MSETPGRIAVSREGGIVRLRLVNATGRNVVDLRFSEAFAKAVRACEAGPEPPSVILVTAEGDSFSVGGDIREFVAERQQIEQHVRKMTTAVHGGILRLYRMDTPVIMAVNGVAAGAGFSLVCGANLVLAARSARFTSAYTRSGLSPDAGGTWFLPRIVGSRRAFELMALNPVLSAEEAHAIGLVTRVVDDDALGAEAEALAQQLAAMPPGALATLKRLLRASREAGLEAQLASEADGIARLAATPTTMARLEAFLTRK